MNNPMNSPIRIRSVAWVALVLTAGMLNGLAAGQEPSSMPATASATATASAPATSAATSAPDRGDLTRDELLRLLEAQQAQLTLDQAHAEMEQAKVELDQIQSLFADKLVTIEKLNEANQKHQQAILKHRQAQIDLDRKRLEFLKDVTLVTVIDAKKLRTEDGDIIAAIRLRNDSDIRKARVVMEGSGELTAERLASLLKVDNVVVTLRGTGSASGDSGSGKAIIGDPFQQIVPALAQGQDIELRFRLLKSDAENVTVSLAFLGQQKDYDVFLKRESQQDLPEISSTQYSLVGQLGSKVKYDVNLERLARSEQSFSLVVLNLPQEIPFTFRDPGSDSVMTQVKFTEDRPKQNLYFEVAIPEKLETRLVDAQLSFYLLVTRQTEMKRIFELTKQYGGKVPPEEIAKLKAKKVELILIPRGVGKLEILVPNSFKEIKQGDGVLIKFNVWNSGTLALRRVTPTLDLPLEWEGELAPKEAEVIPAGEKVLFTASLRPPKDVSIGDYTVKLKSQGHSGVEVVAATDKDFNVHVAATSNVTGTVILVPVLIVLVLGIAVASIKISRR